MRCNYFNGTHCFAIVPQNNNAYKPTDEEQKTLCESDKFNECPRYQAILDILKASKSA